MRSHGKNSEIQCNNFDHCRSLLTKVMKTDNMNPIIWWTSNERYRLALHLCSLLLLVLPKEALAERTQAQPASRAPIVILQEDEKEQSIPVGISSVVYDDYSSVAPEAAAKSYCTPPCGLYVAPGRPLDSSPRWTWVRLTSKPCGRSCPATRTRSCASLSTTQQYWSGYYHGCPGWACPKHRPLSNDAKTNRRRLWRRGNYARTWRIWPSDSRDSDFNTCKA